MNLRKFISLALVFCLFCSFTPVAYAETDYDSMEPLEKTMLSLGGRNVSPNSSGWVASTTYNSNARIVSLANNAIFALISNGLSTLSGAFMSVVGIIMSSFDTGDNLYYTTTRYVRTDGRGHIEHYDKRWIYSDSSRTDLVGIIETAIVTESSIVKSI